MLIRTAMLIFLHINPYIFDKLESHVYFPFDCNHVD